MEVQRYRFQWKWHIRDIPNFFDTEKVWDIDKELPKELFCWNGELFEKENDLTDRSHCVYDREITQILIWFFEISHICFTFLWIMWNSNTSWNQFKFLLWAVFLSTNNVLLSVSSFTVRYFNLIPLFFVFSLNILATDIQYGQRKQGNRTCWLDRWLLYACQCTTTPITYHQTSGFDC